jgi:hypothetical protein
MAAGGDEAKRAFDAMMTMKKIEVAVIEAARRGDNKKRAIKRRNTADLGIAN